MPCIAFLRIIGHQLLNQGIFLSLGPYYLLDLQRCARWSDMESFQSSVATVCYGIISSGTVFFWLCPPHLCQHLTLWSGLQAGDIHTLTQTNINKHLDHTHWATLKCWTNLHTYKKIVHPQYIDYSSLAMSEETSCMKHLI